MATVIDTNVLVSLWDQDDRLSTAARIALDQAAGRGRLVVPGPVFADLMALPQRTEVFLNSFFRETGISTDWILTEPMWRAAGRAFSRYAARHRPQPGSGPRRILADFLIGAYAEAGGHRLLTMDRRIYRAAFPKLDLVVL